MRAARGLYLRGSTWWMSFIGADGALHRESTRTSKKLEARAILEERRAAIRKGDPLPMRDCDCPTFSAYCVEYSEICKHQRAWGREKRYRVARLRRAFGTYRLSDIVPRRLEAYVSARLSDGVTPATVNRETSILKNMLKKAAAWDLVAEDVASRLCAVVRLKERNERTRFLSHDELDRLISACSAELRPMVILAANTGMRRCEILRMKWPDVDFSTGYIRLVDTKTANPRSVPMNAAVRAALAAVPVRAKTGHVFCHPDGRPLRDVRTAFLAALRRAKISDMRFHDLRHTFCSHMIMNGFPPSVVMRISGHRSLQSLQRYVHLNDRQVVESVQDLYCRDRSQNSEIVP